MCRLNALTVAVAGWMLAACSGELASNSTAGASGGAGAPADNGTVPVDPTQVDDQAEQDAIDEMLMEQNPQLFDVATQFFPGPELKGGQKRLHRLTRTQLDATTQALLPGVVSASALDALPADPLVINYEYAENLSFSAANFEPYIQWVAGIADSVRGNPTSVVNCDAADTPCLQTQARAFVTRAFRHVPTAEQIESFVDFFVQSVAAVGLADATADLVDVTLTSPHYVFRDEVLTDPLGTLLPAQLLQHVTYTLADAPPAALGIASDTAQVAVGTAEALNATINQVLASQAARDKLARFIMTWLEIRQADEIESPDIAAQDAVTMVQDASSFLLQQLSADRPSLVALTQTARAGLDPAQRLGIFTEPAFIVSHSGPTEARPIHRGVFFTRKVMCRELGMPPAGIDTSIPEDPNATERQRIEAATAPATCAGCHTMINPYGFMLGNFDHVGQWRTTDEQGRPIDANVSLSLNALDSAGLPASQTVETDSPVAAISAMAQSFEFQQCFTRQMVRYYLGRRELPTDDATLRQMFFQFANGNAQDIALMLTTLAGSSTFSERSEAP